MPFMQGQRHNHLVRLCYLLNDYGVSGKRYRDVDRHELRRLSRREPRPPRPLRLPTGHGQLRVPRAPFPPPFRPEGQGT